ncbi:AAA family ATPase [Xanthobacter sp. KR7-65]|uniref:bifunctional aminoglycoside phosphotransferase/ATP-binding protein n=1 Tax=Xanthobacter sp. KR7-65 TaxID=3156612 RepID=UPI0032B41211
MKRAVLFPFMDFSTLEKRHAACTAEVEISGAAAPGLYLGVVPITREGDRLALGGGGEVIEFAVKMRRFDSGLTLDKVAERGELNAPVTRALAAAVVRAHAVAPIRRGFDIAGRLGMYIADSTREFTARPELFPPDDIAELARLSDAALERVAPVLKSRSAAGFVRRCHGDMHLRNVVLLDGEPVLFDAIEFNDEIATCDVLYDLAFLLMDLWQRGLKAQANDVFNRYLWASDDAQIEALQALPLFLSIRAAIRAKVEGAGLAHLSSDARSQAERRVRHAFAEALRFLASEPRDATKDRPRLVAIGGLSGSGKTTQAIKIACDFSPAPGAVIVRSDIERKRMFGVAETDRLPPEAYTAEVGARVYDRLRDVVRRVLACGYCAIVDAVHARATERDAIEAVAEEAGVRFSGVWLDVPVPELLRRVDARMGDASDADARVVQHQTSYDLGEIKWRRTGALKSLAES